MAGFEGHVERFLKVFPRYGKWKIEKAAITVKLGVELRKEISARGYIPQDIEDLIDGL